MQALQLQPGDSVLDLCTGTGLNLPHLRRAVGPDGKVLGVDFCSQMLARARRRVDRIRPLPGSTSEPDTAIQLLEMDAAALDTDLLQDQIGTGQLDAVICTFGLAVAPNWQQIQHRAWQLLRPGGSFVVADNQPFPRMPLKAINFPWVQLANFSGAAEIRRPTWELPAGAELSSSRQSFLGGFVFVAAGRKPAY